MSRQTDWQAKKTATDLCQGCGKPKGKDRAERGLCLACAKKQSEIQLRRAQRLIEQGLCGNCGKRKIAKSLTRYCRQCQDQMVVGGRSLTEQRKAEGLCQRCGKPKHPKSKSSCLACLEKIRARQRAATGYKEQHKGGAGKPPLK